MRKNVLLYGNSIFLNGLAALLHTNTELTIHLRQMSPQVVIPSDLDVILIDLDELSLETALNLFAPQKNIRLVGIDTKNSRTTVLSRRTLYTSTLNDIVTCL